MPEVGCTTLPANGSAAPISYDGKPAARHRLMIKATLPLTSMHVALAPRRPARSGSIASQTSGTSGSPRAKNFAKQSNDQPMRVKLRTVRLFFGRVGSWLRSARLCLRWVTRRVVYDGYAPDCVTTAKAAARPTDCRQGRQVESVALAPDSRAAGAHGIDPLLSREIHSMNSSARCNARGAQMILTRGVVSTAEREPSNGSALGPPSRAAPAPTRVPLFHPYRRGRRMHQIP
jgi:hypothetical protein